MVQTREENRILTPKPLGVPSWAMRPPQGDTSTYIWRLHTRDIGAAKASDGVRLLWVLRGSAPCVRSSVAGANHTRKFMKKIALNAFAASATVLFYSNFSLAQEVGAGVDAGNRVSLQASASIEVTQDWLSVALSTVREGADAAAVQSQLKAALDAALAVARPGVEKDKMELRSGNFNLSPRYGRDNKINGWQGSVELMLEGRDFERITVTAGKVQTLTLQGLQFGLSPALRTSLESDLQARAIARFKGKAQDVASAFGFGGYQLVQVNVGATDNSGGNPRPMLAMAARAASADMAPVSAEPGRVNVQLTVSGTVRLK